MKCCMAGTLKCKQTACSLRRHVSVAVEGRSESGIIEDRTLKNKISYKKNITDGNQQQMQTVLTV